MTTETSARGGRVGWSRRPVGAVLRGLGLAVVVAVLVVVVAGTVAGLSAADAAGMGGLLGVGVLAFGTLSMNAVATVAPRASLPIGMLTYLVQVTAVLAVLVSLEGSSAVALDDRAWLVAGLVGAVLAWLPGHVLGAVGVAPSPAERDARTRVEDPARDC